MDRLKLNFESLKLPRIPYLPEDHQPVAYGAAAGIIGLVIAKSLYACTVKKNLKLYYFDLAGKGECIRLACAYGGVHLEDVRIPIDNRAKFEELKSEGKLPYGQLPAIELPDGTILAQTGSIMRYIGKMSGLYPTCPVAAAHVDAVIDAESDLFAGLGISVYRDRTGFSCLGPSTVANIRASLNDEVLPRHLGNLERLLEKSSSGWFAGTAGPTIADFVLVPRLQWLSSGIMDGISKSILEPFPKLRALIAKLMALPAVVRYYEDRHIKK